MVRKYNYNDSDSGEGTVWNFDDAEAQLIFNIKKEFISCLLEWDLENAYWKIRTLITECDALLTTSDKDDGEKNTIIKSLNELSKLRGEYNEVHDPEGSVKGDYYFALESLYKEICLLIKGHGLYFRERADDRGL